MAVRSRETLPAAAAAARLRPGLHARGWLFLVDEESADVRGRERRDAGRGGARHRRGRGPRGVPPGVDETGIAYALYEPDSGFADPVATTRAYIAAAARAPAARALRGHAGRARSRSSGDACGACASAGELLECDSVVLAAGPWTLRLAARHRARAAARDHARAGRRLRDRPRAGDPVRGLVAGRPRLHAPGARGRRRRTCSSAAGSRRSTSRSNRTASTTRSTRRSRRTCASASPAGCRGSPGCARSAAASASTT